MRVYEGLWSVNTPRLSPLSRPPRPVPAQGSLRARRWGPLASAGLWEAPSTSLPLPRAPPRPSRAARGQSGTRSERKYKPREETEIPRAVARAAQQ